MGLVRRHLGVVFDICHQSVQFEDIAASLRLLRDSGVPIFKFQAAAALRVPEVTPDAIDALTPFTDTIYLSQTTESRDGKLTRRLNLSDAIDAWRIDPTGRPRVAYPLSPSDIPGRHRRSRHDTTGDRSRLGGARGHTALRPSRDRDVHVGCPARAPQDRGHHRIRQPRAGLDARRSFRAVDER